MIVLSIWFMGCSVSSAALISYSYTNIDSSFDSSMSLLDYINASSTSVTSSLTSFTLVPTEEQSVSKVTLFLDLDSSSTLNIFAGLDATYGAEIYYNGVQLSDSTDDLWWKRSFSNSDVQTASGNVSGSTIIDIVWAEECCGGQSSIAFTSSLFSSDFFGLTVANLEMLESVASPSAPSVSVPAPSSIFILSLGVMLMSRRRLFN